MKNRYTPGGPRKRFNKMRLLRLDHPLNVRDARPCGRLNGGCLPEDYFKRGSLWVTFEAAPTAADGVWYFKLVDEPHFRMPDGEDLAPDDLQEALVRYAWEVVADEVAFEDVGFPP